MDLIPRASRFIKGAQEYKIKGTLYDIHGYLAFTCSKMPLANKAGIVYYHRYIASLKVGRWLNQDEDAHHIDENKRNNHWNNFKVLSRAEHTKWHNSHGLIPKPITYYNRCKYCNKKFIYQNIKQEFCSIMCANKNKERASLTREEILALLRYYNLSQIGRIFEVSTNTVRNWCKKHNIFY